MKKITFLSTLILFVVATFGCEKKNEVADIPKCDYDVIISREKFESAKSSGFTINDLKIDNNCLKVNLSSGGCDGSTWVFELIDSGILLESNPAQRNLFLSLKNEELCNAYITKEVTFDVSELKAGNDKVFLNITNTDDSILYE